MLAWSIWGLFQLWTPGGVLGWVAMSATLVAVVVFLVLLHSVVVQLLVPDVGAKDAV